MTILPRVGPFSGSFFAVRDLLNPPGMNAQKCANWFWSEDVKPPSDVWVTMLTAAETHDPRRQRARTPSPTLRNFLWGEASKT